MESRSCPVDDCMINPGRDSGEKESAKTGILACNPTDAGCFKELASKYRLTSRFLFHSRLYAGENLFLAGPAVGAPMAVLCLEKLIALGAKRIILYGWCGSLQLNLRGRDVLVPTRGLSEEGTSQHYQADHAGEIMASSSLRNWICSVLADKKVDFQQGPVWTTDAPFRETRKKVADYAKGGIMGVDMEYSALCTVAAFRQVELAAVMLVSDELCKSPWKPQYSFKTFKNRSRELLTMLCESVDTSDL